MKKKNDLLAKQGRAGWIFLAPATILIFIMCFYPMIQALLTSFKTGSSANMQWAEPLFYNYTRMFKDKLFIRSLGNTFLYLIIQVPIMLIFAILLAQLLNNKDVKFKGLFRTCVFLPCATSLVSYSLIFKSLFATQGLINTILVKCHILSENFNFLGTPATAKAVIILALIWRWTGYNMVFYLAGLQNIDYSVYEAAKIDGANGWKTFWSITVPLLRPVIIMTFIMSINGTLQLFDESVNLTNGGPANSTITMSHYIFNSSFGNGVANFGYASALSFLVFILVEIGICHSGNGNMRLEQTEIPYSEGMISVIPVNYPHYTVSEEESISYWEYLFLDIEKIVRLMYPDDIMYQRMLLDRLNRRAFLREKEELPEIVDIVEMIFEEIKQKKEMYLEKVKGLAYSLVISLLRMTDTENEFPERIQKKSSFEQIRPCMDYIEEHFADSIKIQTLANLCHMSESNFRRIFVTNMNMSPLEYVNRIRIMKACKMIKQGKLMIEEIAVKTGFPTISTFNRNFKRVAGMSPVQWKKEHDDYESSLTDYSISVEKGW